MPKTPSRRPVAPSKQSHAPEVPLRIHPLTPARVADLATLFGQGGDPKWCWCAFYRVRGALWNNTTPVQNRAVLEKAVRTTARARRAPGLVAYRGDEPVGWMSLGPREDYDRLEHSRVLARLDDKPVWSIVCFVVGRQARGQGVAAALLDAGIAYARDRGATLLEAYPADTGGVRIPSAEAFKGTLTMFERAGFEVVTRRKAQGARAARPIVRRRVRPTQSRAG